MLGRFPSQDCIDCLWAVVLFLALAILINEKWRKMAVSLVVVVAIALCLQKSNATDIWVTQNGARNGGYCTSNQSAFYASLIGTNSGSDLSNAWPIEYLSNNQGGYWTHGLRTTNALANFSGFPVGQAFTNFVVPQGPITFRLSGIFTNGFTLPNNGTNGGPLYTFQFEPDCIFTNRTWPGNSSSATAIIQIGELSGHDLKFISLSPLLFTYPNNGFGGITTNYITFLDLLSCYNVEVSGLVLSNMCYRPPYRNDIADENYYALGIALHGKSSGLCSVHNNTIDMASTGISVNYSGYWNNFRMESNTITRYSIAILAAADTSIYSELSNAKFNWNTIDHAENFDQPTGQYHNNAVHLFSQATTIILWTNAIGYTAPLTPGSYLPSLVLQSNYDANGFCRFSVPVGGIQPSSWWPSTNDHYVFCGFAGATNSNFLVGGTNGPFASFPSFTNHFILHGKSNAPVTANLYFPFQGLVTNCEFAYNRIGPYGSDNTTSVGFFLGDVSSLLGYIDCMVHDNLVLMDTNTGTGGGIAGLNGSRYLVFNNTFYCLPRPGGTNVFQSALTVYNGSGSESYNNLFVNFRSVVDYFQAQVVNQSVAASDYNNYAGMYYWQLTAETPSPFFWTNLYYAPQYGMNYAMTNGFEVNSRTNPPTLNADYSPANTNYLIGTNLTSKLAARGIVNWTDINGVPRPSGGYVTIGAFELNTNYVPPVAVAPNKFLPFLIR